MFCCGFYFHFHYNTDVYSVTRDWQTFHLSSHHTIASYETHSPKKETLQGSCPLLFLSVSHCLLISGAPVVAVEGVNAVR